MFSSQKDQMNPLKIYHRFFSLVLSFLFCSLICFSPNTYAQDSMDHEGVSSQAVSADDLYKEYLAFFREVFDIMRDNYYVDIDEDDYQRFLKAFDQKIYSQVSGAGKSSDFVRWRSAAFLVDFLKEQDDVFSAFYPPKPAKEYEETALGKRIDLGIEGESLDIGYRITFVEPRSNSYKSGLRENDLLVKIDGQEVAPLSTGEVETLLRPLADSVVELAYLNGQTKQSGSVKVKSEEYFKQAVFNVPIPVPKIYCLRIDRFNRKTFEDVFRFLTFYRQQGPIEGLIIDLRGNPGGPPLAAREMSSIFLPAGDEFAYFQKKNQPKAELDVPVLPEEHKYDGPIAILIDDESGSASELFSGVMQRRQRAVLMGENSAGQVFLKSMFPLDDESMLLLVTARGHHPDGEVFSFEGLIPDRYIDEGEKEDILKYAATYIMYVNQSKNQGAAL